MMAEYEGDNNHDHFQRTPEFAQEVAERFSQVSPELRKEFLDFLISSVTSEFSGCILYNEIQKNVEQPRHQGADALHGARRIAPRGLHQPEPEGLRPGPGPGRPEAHQDLHLLQAEVHLLRDLPVREDRLRALHHHLPPARAPPRQALPPDLSLVRALVQRRVPPRRELRADHARAARTCCVAATCCGSASSCWPCTPRCTCATTRGRCCTRRWAWTPPSTTTTVFDITTEISKQVFPVSLDTDLPAFRAGLTRLFRIQQAHRRGQGPRRHRRPAAARRGWRWRALATFARLYLLPVKHHALPAQVRVAPAW